MANAGAHFLENAFASLFAAAARFRTKAAVLVDVRVPFALFRANPAGFKACLELFSHQPRIRLGQPRQDIARGLAHVGTVKVQADAAEEILHGLFAQACVCT